METKNIIHSFTTSERWVLTQPNDIFFRPKGEKTEKFGILGGNFPVLKVADPTGATKNYSTWVKISTLDLSLNLRGRFFSCESSNLKFQLNKV